jgi:hypothetical protein
MEFSLAAASHTGNARTDEKIVITTNFWGFGSRQRGKRYEFISFFLLPIKSIMNS